MSVEQRADKGESGNLIVSGELNGLDTKSKQGREQSDRNGASLELEFAYQHGGNVAAAARYFGFDPNTCLDLSTGINPFFYPIPSVSQSAFRALSYPSQEFIAAAKSYYGSDAFVALSGSQEAIRLLPKLLAPYPILVPELGYQEHAFHWKNSGLTVTNYESRDLDKAISQIDAALEVSAHRHLLLIQPNNPTGLLFSCEQIRRWSQRLSGEAKIIIDEAFIDMHPSASMLSTPLPENCVVLRSFGKFFGLAGLRLGFIFSEPTLLRKCKTELGDWNVCGPALEIATQAFVDKPWQRQARERIAQNAIAMQERVQPLVKYFHARVLVDQGLFLTLILAAKEAELIYRHFASAGILIRIIRIPNESDFMLLRFGLIDSSDTVSVQRFSKAMNALLVRPK